jgi:hypothetical protein
MAGGSAVLSSRTFVSPVISTISDVISSFDIIAANSSKNSADRGMLPGLYTRRRVRCAAQEVTCAQTYSNVVYLPSEVILCSWSPDQASMTTPPWLMKSTESRDVSGGIGRASSTTLYVVASREALHLSKPSVEFVAISDHVMVKWTLNKKKPDIAMWTTRGRDWKVFKNDALCAELADLFPDSLSAFAHVDVDTITAFYNSTIFCLLDKHAPPTDVIGAPMSGLMMHVWMPRRRRSILSEDFSKPTLQLTVPSGSIA